MDGRGAPARVQRTRPWSWIGEGAVAAARGAGLCGLVLPGLILVLALLMPLLLTGLEIGLLVNGPQHWHETDAVVVRIAPLAGLAVSLLLIPAILGAIRGLATVTRKLSGDWCAVPVMDPYLNQPRNGQSGKLYLGRLRWLADPATRRDGQWLAVSTLGGWILAAV